jgi:hypothetical protein
MTESDISKYSKLIEQINDLLYNSLESSSRNIELINNLNKVKKDLQRRLNNNKTKQGYKIG